MNQVFDVYKILAMFRLKISSFISSFLHDGMTVLVLICCLLWNFFYPFFTHSRDFVSVEEFFIDSVPGQSSPPLDEEKSQLKGRDTFTSMKSDNNLY